MHIIEFSVSNFRSIKDLQTLSLLATKAKEHPDHVIPADDKFRLLKSCVLYGANAAGKSNMLKALQGLFAFVENSTKLKPEQAIPCYEPFRLEVGFDSIPCRMELEFFARPGERYLYEIEFDRLKVLFEALHFHGNRSGNGSGKKATLFRRRAGERMNFGTLLKGRKKALESELLPNHLFLTKAAMSNNEQLLDVYKALEQEVCFSTKETQLAGAITPMTTAFLVESANAPHLPDLQSMILDLLRKADTGIEGLELRRTSIDADLGPIPEALAERIKLDLGTRIVTKHSVYQKGKKVAHTFFDLMRHESTGTTKMYKLTAQVIQALVSGGVIVLDELDSDLHPLVSRMIIEMFHDPASNPQQAQLITSTHDVSLLDLDLFRRDQIWFAEKQDGRETNLYSLVEFKQSEVRANAPIGKWYLDGRFGALPLIDGELALPEGKG